MNGYLMASGNSSLISKLMIGRVNSVKNQYLLTLRNNMIFTVKESFRAISNMDYSQAMVIIIGEVEILILDNSKTEKRTAKDVISGNVA